LPYKAPEGIAAGEKGLQILVNTSDVLVMRRRQMTQANPKGLGVSTFAVFDKSANRWLQVQIPGSRSLPCAFGSWVAATAREFDDSQKRISPGRERRQQQPSPHGRPVDSDFQEHRVYAPGILFLFNAETGKSVVVETGEGDSEVLLIDSGDLYYRVNASIYKARLTDAGIGPAQVLVTDAAVFNVHWAFLGPPR
jgi:hypothetical protein